MRKINLQRFNPKRLKSFAGSNPVAVTYMLDGLLIYAANQIAGYGNNIYASRLGAGDYELSLVQFIPQMLNMLVLIPGGLIIDSLRSKRRMVTGSLLAAGFLYLLCGFAPLVGAGGIFFFLSFLSMAMASVALLNISWQAFFPEVVPTDKRNSVLALRTQVGVFLSMLIPLIAGAILAAIKSAPGKILAHQIMYASIAVLMTADALYLRKLKAVNPVAPKKVAWAEIKKAARSLRGNKPFLLFTLSALFFYMTWHMDWTLYYIGQVQYLKLNEFLLGIVTVGGTAVQFLTMRFWSKKNERHGVAFPLVFGIIGLSLYPLSMVAAVSLPASVGPAAFILFNTVSNFAQATILLNVFQCQLQVSDEKYRSIYFSVFACLTCLSNAIMPVAGVALYRAIGGDLNALRCTFIIIFALRLCAAGVWMYWCKKGSPST